MSAHRRRDDDALRQPHRRAAATSARSGPIVLVGMHGKDAASLAHHRPDTASGLGEPIAQRDGGRLIAGLPTPSAGLP
jgi:hypothetical protein